MFRRSNARWPVWLLLNGAFIVSAVHAAGGVAVRDRAVDVITLVDGKQLLGMFAQPPNGNPTGGASLTFHVARDWLRKHRPAFYRKLAADEGEQRRAALEQYRQRLLEWRQRRAEPMLLRDFIQRSLRDVESQLQNQTPVDDAHASQLMIVEAPARQVKRWHAQPPNVRRLLALAWEARAPDVEQLPASELSQRLKSQGVDVEHGEPDLSDRFNLVPLTPRQWAAQVALIEFEILGKPHFQGTGGTLLEADGPAMQMPLADLVGGLLQDQLGDALGDLLNPRPGENRGPAKSKQRAGIEKALASAAEQKATGARVTYLDQDLPRRRVTVTDTFYALMPDGVWQPLWRQPATINADDAKSQAIEALAADPQVAQIMRTIKGLGLDANQDLFKSALRFGAATQKATQATEREFASYLRGHTRRLMGPPVVVAEPKNQP